MAAGALSRLGSTGSIIWAVVLIALGFVAIAVPFVVAAGVVLIIGWLLIFAAVAQAIHAFETRGAGGTVWKLLVAAFYVLMGGYFLAHPILGLAAMTLILAFFFVAEGISELLSWVQNRKLAGSVWLLLNGVITLFLGLLVWRHWPSSSTWVIGTLIGISIIMTGTTRLMLNLSARRLRGTLSRA